MTCLQIYIFKFREKKGGIQRQKRQCGKSKSTFVAIQLKPTVLAHRDSRNKIIPSVCYVKSRKGTERCLLVGECTNIKFTFYRQSLAT